MHSTFVRLPDEEDYPVVQAGGFTNRLVTSLNKNCIRRHKKLMVLNLTGYLSGFIGFMMSTLQVSSFKRLSNTVKGNFFT
jgi:hypothetical protein